MPLEMEAIVQAFALEPAERDGQKLFEGRVGAAAVTAIHTGMGPPRTRAALSARLDAFRSGRRGVSHVMVAGICGGLSPDLEVGTLINPELVVDHRTGTVYRHRPPMETEMSGNLITTEEATLDHDLSRKFFDDGFVAVDMESSAVAEVCESRGLPWSVYRCIGDRYFDGLLDEKVLGLSNPDGSANIAAVEALLASDPSVVPKLEQLGRDASSAARLAADAAARACIALFS